MKNKALPDQILEWLPPIPEGAHNRFGDFVLLTTDEIQLHDPVRVSPLSLNMMPSGVLRYAAKLRIAYAIPLYAPEAIRSEYSDISNLIRYGGSPQSFEEMDVKWWNTLRQKLRGRSSEWRLSRLRQWFLWLSSEGFPGVDETTADVIEAWAIPGGVKGEAVRSRDTQAGPLTWGQFAHLVTKISNLAKRSVTAQLTAVQLCVNLGVNCRQLALLEERDFGFKVDPATGEKDYFIEMPRIKKRLAYRVTKRRHLQRETGLMVEAMIAKNKILREHVEWEEPGKMPIFSRRYPRKIPENSPLYHRFEWHSSVWSIHALISQFSDTHELRAGGSSERYYLSARRLRYTFATMLAATGAPPVVIAEALDHSDLQHVGVYVLATGKLADRLNQAIGHHIEPWIIKFMEGPVNSVPGKKPNTILNPDSSKALGIGYCGLSSQCHLFPPDTCYGCDFFQPWIEADHKSVLHRLEVRKSILIQNRSGSSDRMPHQLDAVIENVKLVIEAQKIAQRRAHDQSEV